MVQATEIAKSRGERQIISSKSELLAAVVEITSRAERTLVIMTPDLEPPIYEDVAFLDALKRFVLAKSFARVRVLITDPERAMKNGNQFFQMGSRLNSYIEFRSLKPELKPRDEAFCIADGRAVVYRARSDSWEGMVDTFAPPVASRYLETFDELWQAC